MALHFLESDSREVAVIRDVTRCDSASSERRSNLSAAVIMDFVLQVSLLCLAGLPKVAHLIREESAVTLAMRGEALGVSLEDLEI